MGAQQVRHLVGAGVKLGKGNALTAARHDQGGTTIGSVDVIARVHQRL
jgi:hypothetical protein